MDNLPTIECTDLDQVGTDGVVPVLVVLHSPFTKPGVGRTQQGDADAVSVSFPSDTPQLCAPPLPLPFSHAMLLACWQRWR